MSLPSTVEPLQSQNRRSNSERHTSTVVAVAAVAVAAAVVAKVGQSVVHRGRRRELFCKSRILDAAKIGSMKAVVSVGLLPQNVQCARLRTLCATSNGGQQKNAEPLRAQQKPTVIHSEPLQPPFSKQRPTISISSG